MNKALSVSQIKKFMKSPSQRAGEYLLGIKDEFKSDALHIGSAFHKYCETGDHKDRDNLLSNCEDLPTARDQYDILCSNFDKIEDKPKWESEVKFETEIRWVPFVWYIDCLQDDCIVDYKSVSSLSKPSDSPAMRQSINNFDEYVLQAYIYMHATKKPKAKFIEIMKKQLKTRPDEWWQVIEFNYNEIADMMHQTYEPIINQIKDLYEKYSQTPKLS